MDWSDRDVAVLFGDGAAAVVLEASDQEEGVLAEKLGCYGDARETLRVQGMGGRYANRGVLYRHHALAVRGSGDLQARRAGHEQRL